MRQPKALNIRSHRAPLLLHGLLPSGCPIRDRFRRVSSNRKGLTVMTESEAVEGQAFRAERSHDQVVLRFPSLNRLVRAFLPAEAVKHLYAAQREQLLTVRSVVDALVSYVEAA